MRQTQNEIESSGVEVISIGGGTERVKSSRSSPLKREVSVPTVDPSFGEDLEVLDQILLDNVPLFAAAELRAQGKVTTKVLDLTRNAEDGTLSREEKRDDNADVRVWKRAQAPLFGGNEFLNNRFKMSRPRSRW